VGVKLKYPLYQNSNGEKKMKTQVSEKENPVGGSRAGEGAFPPTPHDLAQLVRKELDRKLKELNIELNEKLRKEIERYAYDWASEELELELESEEEEKPIPVEGFVMEAVEVALEEFGIVEGEEEEEW
jgi:hypothetical protein